MQKYAEDELFIKALAYTELSFPKKKEFINILEMHNDDDEFYEEIYKYVKKIIAKRKQAQIEKEHEIKNLSPLDLQKHYRTEIILIICIMAIICFTYKELIEIDLQLTIKTEEGHKVIYIGKYAEQEKFEADFIREYPEMIKSLEKLEKEANNFMFDCVEKDLINPQNLKRFETFQDINSKIKTLQELFYDILKIIISCPTSVEKKDEYEKIKGENFDEITKYIREMLKEINKKLGIMKSIQS